ncbi:MAG TPA: EF-hand domain-containing protein [Methyloceanibacter sp.]|nr:EF-hand domain-containing protein [Methyloceanibacter sp.]
MKAKLILIGCALLFVSNVADAQEANAPTSAQEQEAPTAKMTGEDMMGHKSGMMGGGMMGRGMMCGDKMSDGMMGSGMMGRGMCMRVMFALMDADGDGGLSLEEFQTAHAKIFKAVDANEDGKVTAAELRTFMSGGSPTSPQ